MRTHETAPMALTLREAAAQLSISQRTLWKLAKDGRIPCVNVGTGGRRRKLLFPVEGLREWLVGGRHE
jgi:excisionase family DNA binding protein